MASESVALRSACDRKFSLKPSDTRVDETEFCRAWQDHPAGGVPGRAASQRQVQGQPHRLPRHGAAPMAAGVARVVPPFRVGVLHDSQKSSMLARPTKECAPF